MEKSKLREKWYYRLLIVVYIFLFLITEVIAIAGVYSITDEGQEEKITKDSLIKIGKEIKNEEFSDLYNLQNPSKIAQANCPLKSVDEDRWVECMQNYYLHNPERDKEDAAREVYVKSKLDIISDDEFFNIGEGAYKNDYVEVRKAIIARQIPLSIREGNDTEMAGEISETIAKRRVGAKEYLEKYEPVPIYSVWEKITYFIIATLIVILIFLTIQRAFYFIVLGKFFPK